MSGPLVENFRDDYGAVAETMQRSCADNAAAPSRYTPEFLESSFPYPGACPILAPTIYDGDRPLALVAGFPRRIRCEGRDGG